LAAGIVELWLERAEAKNAIGKDMLQGLRSAIEEVEADAAANVVLVASSVPRVFCAGADLKVAVVPLHRLCSAGSVLLARTFPFVICAGTYGKVSHF
jgi:enoyl-CoA hydratase/carnithine racemase